MSNLKLDLIEKVRKGEAAIRFNPINCSSTDLEKIRTLYREIYPDEDITITGNANYYYTNYNKGWSGDMCPIGMTPIPLQSFFTNQLTPEDNKTIEQLDERLKRLETLVYGFDTNPLGVDVIQPSPAKDEVEYVECVRWRGEVCTVG